MQLDITEAQVIEDIGRSITELYDTIYAFYDHTTSDGVKLDTAWCLAQYPELERKRLRDAMQRRKRMSELPEGVTSRPMEARDREAVKRAVRNKPEAIVEAVNQLPAAERKAIKAQIDEGFAPLKDGLAAVRRSGIALVLEELADDVVQGQLVEGEREEIQAALDKFVLAFTEACWKVEN